jgi:hypothetical protein
LLTQIYRSLGGYIGGMLLLVVTNALFAGIFLAVIGVPYFLPLAVMSGIGSVIPYVGAFLVGTVLSVVAWVNNGIWMEVFTVGYFIAYQQFENNVVSPLVYRRTVDLNPLVILIAALFMTALAGSPARSSRCRRVGADRAPPRGGGGDPRNRARGRRRPAPTPQPAPRSCAARAPMRLARAASACLASGTRGATRGRPAQ